MLSYYSMHVSSIFIPEGFMALFLSNQGAGVPTDLNNLYTMMSTFSDLLKNEHLFDHGITREKTLKRLKFFFDRGVLEMSEDKKEIWLKEGEANISTLNFFKGLILPLVDTYLIVLLTIE